MPMVDNNHGHIFGNGSLNAESDKKYRSCVFIWCRRWLNIGWISPTAWGGFAFLFTRNIAHHPQCPLIRKIYLHIMHIYTLAVLTDIATIVHNNGMRRIAYSLNIGIIWLCRTVLCILFSKLGERINIHYAVIRWAVRTDCLHGAYQWGKVQWENKNWKSSRQHTFWRTKSFTRHRSCSVWMEISLPVPLNRENRICKSTPHRRFPARKSSRWSICRSLCGGSYPRCCPLLSE